MSKSTRGELYRNTRQGKIKGVCAGLADYFGWEAWLIRVLVVSGVLLGMQWFIVVYIAAVFILDKKPKTTNNHYANTHNKSNNSSNENQEFKTQYKQNQHSVFDDETVNESIKVKSRIWQAGEPAKKALYAIRGKYTKLEKELRVIESYVTSPQFTVAREINKL